MTHDPADLLAAAAPRLSPEAKARHLQILAAEQAATPAPPTLNSGPAAAPRVDHRDRRDRRRRRGGGDGGGVGGPG